MPGAWKECAALRTIWRLPCNPIKDALFVFPGLEFAFKRHGFSTGIETLGEDNIPGTVVGGAGGEPAVVLLNAALQAVGLAEVELARLLGLEDVGEKGHEKSRY